MIPLHDDNPTRIWPLVTVGLIVANALVFLWQVSLPRAVEIGTVYGLGFIPAVWFQGLGLPAELTLVPAPVTVVTSMFLHGGWMHLIMNMLYLWIFGNNVEDAMGHLRFVVFYLLCGGVAVLAHGLAEPSSQVPLIGASGAISGVLGAYLLLHPHSRVLVLIPLGIIFWTMRIRAVIVLGFWFGLQFLNVLGGASAGGVAWWAHIGGFVAGMALIPFFKNRNVPLWDRGRRPAGHSPVPTVTRRRGPWG